VLLGVFLGLHFLVRSLIPVAGGMTAALSVLPVAVIVWLFGVRWGAVAIVVCLSINTLILNAAGYSGWSAFTEPRGAFSTILLVLIAAGIIWVKGLYDRNQRMLQEHRRTAKQRDRLLQEATERTRELSCLYGVVHSIQKGGTVGEVFRRVVTLMPPGWRYPDAARARILFDGVEYVSEPFDETEWRVSREIIVEGETRGIVEVSYTEDWPGAGERAGPFNLEEMLLLESISRSLADMVHRKESEDAVQRETQARAVLAEIGLVASSSLEIGEVYSELAEHTRLLVPFDRMVITSIDRERGAMTNVFVTGTKVPGWGAGTTDPMREGEDGQLPWVADIRDRQPIIRDENETRELAKRWPAEAASLEAGLRSSLIVPVVWQEQVIGTLNFRCRTGEACSDRVVELAERIAAQISGAIANSRLHEQVLREAREREVLAEIGRIISSSLRIDDVYEEFASQVQFLFPVDLLAVYVLDQPSGSLVAQHVAGGESARVPKGSRLLMGDLSIEYLFPGRTGVIFDESAVSSLARRMGAPAEQIHAGFRSILAVPLVSRDKAIGVLCLRSMQYGAYGEQNLALAERIGAQIAGAMSNARLHAEVQRQAAEREMLAQIGRIISSTLDIDAVYKRFADEVRRLLPFDMISITTTDFERGTATHAFAEGDLAIGRAVGDPIPLTETLTDAVARERTGRVLSDIAEPLTEQFPSLAPLVAAGARSILSVPLVSKGQTIGTLQLTSREQEAYRDENLALAERIAAQIAGGIANARMHAATLEAEQALRVSESRYRGLVETSHDLVYHIDVEGRYTYLNPAWETVLGYRVEEMLGRGVWEFQTPEVAGLTAERFRRDSGFNWLTADGFEMPHQTRRGDTVFLVHKLDEVLGADGQRAGIQGTAHDVTEERRALAELRARGAALEAAADAMVITDRSGTIEYVNEAFIALTGYSKEEAVGQNPRILKSSWQDEAYYRGMWDTILAGNVWEGRLVNRRKDGLEYPEEMSITPVLGADGAIARFIAVKRDISERIRAEEDRALRLRLDAENRELQRVAEVKSQFLSTVSHELRTPLTSIIAFTDIVGRNRERNLDPRQLAQLDVIRRNGRRLNELIKDLLDVSRVDGGTLKLEQTEFDAHRLFDEVLSNFAPILEERVQVLETSVPDGELWMHADQNRLAQVASNLLSNASKYSPEGSRIDLAAHTEGGRLHLEVRDGGIGIADEDMPRLFTPFFRADNEQTRSVSGTGLGLVITKAIVEEHGGEISVDSEFGAGTTVRVSIPGLLDRKAA